MSEVHARKNPKRASVLAEEALVAAAQGRGEVEDWLNGRAFCYLVGQE